MTNLRRICSICAAGICATMISTLAFGAPPESVFQAYYQAILSGQWEEAKSAWLPEVIEKSERLNITFTGIKAKYDCASSIIQALNGIRSGDVHVEVGKAAIYGDWALLLVKLSTASDTVNIPYYLVKSNGRWKLATALQVRAGDWQQISTRYATVRFQDSALINEIATSELDAFIARMSKHFKISECKMKKLEIEKIEYYLCDEADIEKLTGYPCQGMTNLQQDAVITRHLPHYHELVHLLINFSLDELPLYTQPFMQEGLAVGYGGRWGKSPGVLLQLGHFLLDHKFVELEALLTYKGFHQQVGNPDFSYPVSGLFVKFLIEVFGIERFRTLYLHLSGTDEEVRGLTLDDVRRRITDACGLPWTEIMAKFSEYWRRYQYSGTLPGGDPSQSEPVAYLKSANLSAHVGEVDNWYIFRIDSKVDDPKGVILMKDPSLSATDYRSRNFAEHLPNAEYNGEIYGIQFTQNEVGLYHYPTNNLLAKYVLSLSPGNKYWDGGKRTIHFRLEKESFKENITGFQLRLIEP